jgi:hypothetical protein
VPEATGGIGITFSSGAASELAALLLGLLPLRIVAAVMLVLSGGATFFFLCDLLTAALGNYIVRGTAGFVADVVFAVVASLWTAFWLTRLTHFPFILAAVLAAGLVAYLYREIPRQREVSEGMWS